MFYILPSSNLKNVAKIYALDSILAIQKSEECEKCKKCFLMKDIDEKIIEEAKRGKRIGLVHVNEKKFLQMGFPAARVVNFQDFLIDGFKFTIIPKSFFHRDAKEVAMSLLGKMIVKREKNRYIIGKIVETEAYFGPDDPASRAYRGKKNYNRGMWLPGGHIFIYMVHANWMFNITTDGDEAQAILISAVEPLVGIDIMNKNRGGKKISELCSEPGKWSQAFGIEKRHNGMKLGGEIFIAESPWHDFEVKMSKRVGVREDLDEDMRFYIENSRFVSKVKQSDGKK